MKSCHVLDLVQGQWLSRFEGHDQSVINGDISSSGDLAVTADGDGIVYVWRTADGSRHGPALVGQSKITWSAGWSHDGRSLSWGNTDRRDSIEQLNPMERSFRLGDLAFGGRPGVGFSAAQQTREPLRTRIPEGLKSVSILNGNALQTSLRLPPEYSEDLVRCCTLLPGDRAVVGTDFKLYLYDTRTGSQTRTFQGHTAPVYAVAPSPDGRYFVSASGDMTLRVWSPDHDRPLLSLFFAGDEWIAWTPEGYYAASLGGEQLMGWQVNNGPDRMATYYPASQFRKTLYRPDVIKRLLEAGSTAKALAQADQQSGRPSELTEVSKVLPPKVRMLAPGPSDRQLPGGRLEVRAAAVASGGRPVTLMRLLVNGRPHSEARTLFRDEMPGEVTTSWKVDLPPGTHRLSAKAASAVSDSISDEVVVTVPGLNPARPGATATLFLVAIGINAYPADMSPLDAAAPDARSITECFRRHSRVLFKDVESKLLLDGQAKRRDIRKALEWLKSRAKPGDVAVVFYAGHGVASDQFYLAPVDFNRHNPARTGIKADELKEWLQIPCDTLLLLDACYAGRFDADKKRLLPEAADRVVRELVYDEGMVVMCGANKEQEAGEEENGQHGYFTRALLEGLGGKAKPDEEGMVDISALWAYVEPLVPRLSDGADSDPEPVLGREVVRPFQALNWASVQIRCVEKREERIMSMNRSTTCLGLLSALLAGAPAASGGAEGGPADPSRAAAARADEAFGFDLFARLREREGNLLFSPQSLSIGLALAHSGPGARRHGKWQPPSISRTTGTPCTPPSHLCPGIPIREARIRTAS